MSNRTSIVVNPILLDALTAEEAYKLGIFPLNGPTSHLDMNRRITEMSAEDVRKAKRKFRKFWRKMVQAHARKEANEIIAASDLAHRLGFGEKRPREHHAASRKILTQWELRRRARHKALG